MGIDCWGYMYFVWILGSIGVLGFFFGFFFWIDEYGGGKIEL